MEHTIIILFLWYWIKEKVCLYGMWKGKENIMNFLSAYSAVNQGHCHPRIIDTLVKQARKADFDFTRFFITASWDGMKNLSPVISDMTRFYR